MRTAKNERICLDLVPLSERNTTAAVNNNNSNNNNNDNDDNNNNNNNNNNNTYRLYIFKTLFSICFLLRC